MSLELHNTEGPNIAKAAEGLTDEATSTDNRWKVSDRVRQIKRKRKHRRHYPSPAVGHGTTQSLSRSDVVVALRTVTAFLTGMRSVSPQALVSMMLDPRVRESVRVLAEVKVIDIIRSIQTEPDLMISVLEVVPNLSGFVGMQEGRPPTGAEGTIQVASPGQEGSLDSWFENM
jgi:hypothetical protein